MLRILVSVVLVAVLAACAKPLVDPEAARAAVLTDFGLDPSTVVYQNDARYAIGSGAARPTAFSSGLYVQTQDDLHLFRRIHGGKAYELHATFPLDKLQYVALENWSFTHLKQLQLGAPSGMIVVNFHDTPDAMAGDGDKAESAYTALLNANVRARSSSGRIAPEQAVKPLTEVYPVTVK